MVGNRIFLTTVVQQQQQHKACGSRFGCKVQRALVKRIHTRTQIYIQKIRLSYSYLHRSLANDGILDARYDLPYVRAMVKARYRHIVYITTHFTYIYIFNQYSHTIKIIFFVKSTITIPLTIY